MRFALLASALSFVLLLGVLTLLAVISGGFNVLTLLTLLVLALLGSGIAAAVRGSPPED